MGVHTKESDKTVGVRFTHSNLYDRVKDFKRRFHEFPEPMIWFTKEDSNSGEIRIHYGTLDDYRGCGYGVGNDPDTLIFSLGTGVYHTMTEELGSESVSKIERVLYAKVKYLVV